MFSLALHSFIKCLFVSSFLSNMHMSVFLHLILCRNCLVGITFSLAWCQNFCVSLSEQNCSYCLLISIL